MRPVPVKNSPLRSAALLFLCSSALTGLSCQPGGPSPERLQARWHNNQGVVYMDQHNYVRGREQFAAAAAADPSYALARSNLGIALFSLGKYDSALVALDEALERHPHLLHSHYTRGLIFHAQGKEHEAALAAFEVVVAADDDDPLVHYYLGRTLAKLERGDEAVAEFERAIELDPTSVSAHYALAHQFRLQQRTAEWRRTLEKFDQLSRAGHEGVSSSYQGQGKYAEALADGSYAGETREAPAAAISFELRHEAPPGETPLAAAAVAGIDGEDRPGLVVATAAGIRLWSGSDGEGLGADERWSFPVAVEGAGDLAFGDFDGDGDSDMVVSAAASLAAVNEGGRFGKSIPLGGASSRSVPADVDHDGDLDLLQAGAGGKRLLSNDGSAAFTDITQDAGVGGDPGREAVFSDFDNDRDVDFLVLSDGGAVELYENNRDGTFSDRAADRGIGRLSGEGSAIADICVGDLSPDGRMDIASISPGGEVRTFENRGGGRGFEGKRAGKVDLDGARGIRAADVDNDGDLDLVAFGKGGIRFLQRTGGSFRPSDATLRAGEAAGLVLLEDFDGDGDLDLWSDGELHANTTAGGSWVRIGLSGLNSNLDGFGAKVEVKTRSHQQKRELRGGSRSPSSLTFGLGAADSVEFVRILWPSGVRQTELATAARQRLDLVELNRKGTSCPILYAWDGSRFRFVTDFLGGGIIGYLTAPGEYYTPDHDEYVRIGELVPKEGRYVLQAANQLEEIIYLDAAELIAVDHPPGLEVHPNERLLSAPPYPQFEACALAGLRPLAAARDDRGNDILGQLEQVDDDWYDGFERLRIHGYAREYSLILDLGDLSGMKRPALLAHGWVDYAHSTSNWAAAQARLQLSSPRLEIPDGAGGWRTAIADLGVPAGLPKRMLVDLSGALPAGVRQVRITTTAAVYFDQILIGDIAEGGVTVHRRGFEAADLHWRGYPEHTSIKGTFAFRYDYGRLDPYTDWGTHAGAFTRLGPVSGLLREVDDRFVIMSHGDELTMEVAAAAFPPLAEGMSRTFLFYSDGFGKDMDFHSAASLTVEPLPFHGMSRYPYPATESYPTSPEHVEYVLEYNTRRVAGYYE